MCVCDSERERERERESGRSREAIRPKLKTSLYLESCSWDAIPKQPTDTASDDTSCRLKLKCSEMLMWLFPQIFLGLTTFSQPVNLQGANWDWCIETSTWHLLMSVILSIIVLYFHDWTIAQRSGTPTRNATKWNWRMSEYLQVELSQSPPTQLYLID